MTMGPSNHPAFRIAAKTLRVAVAAERALTHLYLYRVPRAVVLDTIFGPAEDIEYVSRTHFSRP